MKGPGPAIKREATDLARSPDGTQQDHPGTVQDILQFVSNPALESDAGLRALLQELPNRYPSDVPFNQVVYRLLPSAQRRSVFGPSRRLEGRSYWDGRTPVIELPQDALDRVHRHQLAPAGQNRPSTAEVSEVLVTIGHELHHLWREKQRHRANPVYPIYEREAQRRMAEVRRNWLRTLRPQGSTLAPNADRHALGIPRNLTINRWEDIPAAARQRIEQGAAQTDYIQGLFERSAYLVEEIYSVIEELHYLRIQQRFEDPTQTADVPLNPREGSGGAGTREGPVRVGTPSQLQVGEAARRIYYFSNFMRSMAGAGPVISPQLLAQTRGEMLSYLRQRYPNRHNSRYDSFKVIFFLAAIHYGAPPLFRAGRLISRPPPGARVPTRP